MQPSVVWIGEAEKMFYKKVPKEEKEVFFLAKMVAKNVLARQSMACFCGLVCEKDGSQASEKRHAEVSQAYQGGGSCPDHGDVQEPSTR